MIRLRLLLFFLSFTACWSLESQSLAETIRIKDSIYQSQITKSRIDEVYIPKDVPDAMKELERKSPAESIARLRQIDEETMAKKLHFGLGRWMVVNWQLNLGSRLSHYLSKAGLKDEDEMTRFLLISYHRHIMKKDLQSEELIKSIKAKREEEYRRKMKEQFGIDSVIIKN